MLLFLFFSSCLYHLFLQWKMLLLQCCNCRIIKQIQFDSIWNLSRSTKWSFVGLWAEKNAMRFLFTSDISVPAYVCRQFPVCVSKINKNYYALHELLCIITHWSHGYKSTSCNEKKPHIRMLVHFPHDVHNVCFTILENMTNHSGDVDRVQ